jgi:hypothetical protein
MEIDRSRVLSYDICSGLNLKTIPGQFSDDAREANRCDDGLVDGWRLSETHLRGKKDVGIRLQRMTAISERSINRHLNERQVAFE